MFAAGSIDAAQLARITRHLHRDLDDLGHELADMAQHDALAEFSGKDPAAVWERIGLDRRRAVIRSLMAVTVHPAPRGRRPGWRPGESYFDPAGVAITWLSGHRQGDEAQREG